MSEHNEESLQTPRAQCRTRTDDPLLTMVGEASTPVASGDIQSLGSDTGGAPEDGSGQAERPKNAPTKAGDDDRVAALERQLAAARDEIDNLREANDEARHGLAAATHRRLVGASVSRSSALSSLRQATELLGAFVGGLHPESVGGGREGALQRIEDMDSAKLRALSMAVMAAGEAYDAFDDHSRWSASLTMYGDAVEAEANAIYDTFEDAVPTALYSAVERLRRVVRDLHSGRDYPEVQS